MSWNVKTRVVKCHARCHDSSRGKNFFHGKPRIFTRQILRGTMRVHACKSEVINERYCMYGQMFIFVKNFHINNLLVLEIFHVFTFRGTRVPTKII